MIFFYFYSNFKRKFRKQRVETLSLHFLPMPHKKMISVNGLRIKMNPGLYCLLRQNRSSKRKKTIFHGNYNLWPVNIYNGPSGLNCIQLYGNFHWAKKG